MNTMVAQTACKAISRIDKIPVTVWISKVDLSVITDMSIVPVVSKVNPEK